MTDRRNRQDPLAGSAPRIALPPALRATSVLPPSRRRPARIKGNQAALRDKGFRVTVKPLRHVADEDGTETVKSRSDLGMTIDALSESDRPDAVLVATCDGDFVEVVRALQKKGCRVELLGFDNVLLELREAADQFISGYRVPGPLPVRDAAAGLPAWGRVGSRVRGVCNRFEPDDGYGFIAFRATLPDTPLLAAAETSPACFRSSSFHDPSVLSRLPSSNTILEFDLAMPAKQTGAPEARRIQVVSAAWRPMKHGWRPARFAAAGSSHTVAAGSACPPCGSPGAAGRHRDQRPNAAS